MLLLVLASAGTGRQDPDELPKVTEGSFFLRRVPARDHLRIESLHSMLRVSSNRGVLARSVSVLAIALMCVMGMAQATHSHNDENSSTARHTCSICATAHAGISTATTASVPVLFAAPLAIFVAAVSLTFRPAATHFIRPPPAF